MNITESSEAYNDICMLKFNDEYMDRSRFSIKMKEAKKILNMVIEDDSFQDTITDLEKKFYKNITKSEIKHSERPKGLDEDSKDFFFMLIRYINRKDNYILKKVKNEFKKHEQRRKEKIQTKEVEVIKEYKKDEFLYFCNDFYMKLKKEENDIIINQRGFDISKYDREKKDILYIMILLKPLYVKR